MEQMTRITDTFGRVVANRHAYAQQWKAASGSKMLGYLCTYVPEELIYAAGVLPVRIMGNRDPQSAESPNIYSWYCPYCRDCLYQGLAGKYSYLDGIVGGHTCIHMRGVFDSWEKHVTRSYSYHVYVPYHVKSPHASKLVTTEFDQFKTSLEGWLGKSISEENLDRAIQAYNTNRDLLSRINALRKVDPPLLSGAEATEVVLSSMLMDKEEHNALLEKALADLPQRLDKPKRQVRLMLLGAENDDVDLVRLIESLGTNVVVDDYCTGSRYYEEQVPPGTDRMKTLAARYLKMPMCPEKDLVDRWRPARLEKLAREYQVRGAIITQQRYCDRFGWDIPVIQERFNANAIPSLVLELDTTVPIGQLRTRIEAFVEMLG